MSWWLDALNPEGLSQGDIVTQILSGSADHPLKYLMKEPLDKGSKKLWPETSTIQLYKTDGRGLYIARGRMIEAIVVSHSCELDKGNNTQVLLAPIAKIERVQVEHQKNILQQKRHAFMPLPDVPELGTCYADLRYLHFADRKNVPDKSRHASMTDEGVLRLRAQIVAFFSRIDPSALESAIEAAIEAEKKAG